MARDFLDGDPHEILAEYNNSHLAIREEETDLAEIEGTTSVEIGETDSPLVAQEDVSDLSVLRIISVSTEGGAASRATPASMATAPSSTSSGAPTMGGARAALGPGVLRSTSWAAETRDAGGRTAPSST